MSLQERLTEDMKQAMKEKEAGKTRLSVIRMARAAIKNAEIEKKKQLDDAEVVEVLAREVKLRRDAIEEFKKGNRDDMVRNLEEEISILMGYLPQQLSVDEIRQLAREAIDQVKAVDARDIGKVMGVLIPKTKGRADGKVVNTIVREILNK